MFVVRDKETGLYYKKGSNGKWNSTLATIDKCTKYSTRAGAVKSVGGWEPVPGGSQIPRRRYGKCVLDDSKWDIVPVSITEVAK